ncbi:hypothetical protein J2W51_001558 [Tardiphaga robiniae]|jgi:hypothetical protein|nr:hypothetical protein [Tardiphaga robiniae]
MAPCASLKLSLVTCPTALYFALMQVEQMHTWSREAGGEGGADSDARQQGA